jgi:hypothetical protein
MVAGYEWISPTRMAGLAVYSVTALACALRSFRCGRDGVSGRIFAVLAAVQLALLLDMGFDWRWRIHDYWMHKAMDLGLYTDRRSPQLFALFALGLTLALGGLLLWHRFRQRPGLALTLIGTLLSLELWCCECLSYHFVDAVLYRLVGKLMAISLVWIGLAAVTCFGVWVDDRRHGA